MVDAAIAWRALGGRVWFVAPTGCAATHRQSVVEMLREAHSDVRPDIVTWPLAPSFEFGTSSHRAHTYAGAIEKTVPRGVPIIVSDDPAAWAAAAMLAERNPFVGVAHQDEKSYYANANRYQNQLAGLACVSNRICERLKRSITRIDLPVTTIPCGIPRVEVVPRANGRMDGDNRLAWVGRIEEASKRVSDLPRITIALREAAVPFHVDIVGDGPDRSVIEKQISAAGLSPQVSFHGWLDRSEVCAILADTDVFLLPSNFEGMSVAVMEALAAGCAVVCSRTSGIEDYMTDERAERCVWTYPIGDVLQAVRCIRQALNQSSHERRARSVAFARSAFSIEHCVEAYATLLGRLRPPSSRQSAALPRIIRARLSAVASRPIAALRSGRLATTAE